MAGKGKKGSRAGRSGSKSAARVHFDPAHVAQRKHVSVKKVLEMSETRYPTYEKRGGKDVISMVPKGENLHLGRDVKDIGRSGLSQPDEITAICREIETDYRKGLLRPRGVASQTGMKRTGLAQLYASWQIRKEEAGKKPEVAAAIRKNIGLTPRNYPILREKNMRRALMELSATRTKAGYDRPITWRAFMSQVRAMSGRRKSPSMKQKRAWAESAERLKEYRFKKQKS